LTPPPPYRIHPLDNRPTKWRCRASQYPARKHRTIKVTRSSTSAVAFSLRASRAHHLPRRLPTHASPVESVTSLRPAPASPASGGLCRAGGEQEAAAGMSPPLGFACEVGYRLGRGAGVGGSASSVGAEWRGSVIPRGGGCAWVSPTASYSPACRGRDPSGGERPQDDSLAEGLPVPTGRGAPLTGQCSERGDAQRVRRRRIPDQLPLRSRTVLPQDTSPPHPLAIPLHICYHIQPNHRTEECHTLLLILNKL
jgi:hypothetical protein